MFFSQIQVGFPRGIFIKTNYMDVNMENLFNFLSYYSFLEYFSDWKNFR
jgi:hypothetical protein